MKAVLYPLIRLESARNEARGTDERARGRGKGQTPVWGRAHAARDPQRPRALLCVFVCVCCSGLFDSLSVLTRLAGRERRSSMHETHMTQRDPDFSEQSGNAHPYVHPSLPLVSPNSLYALSNLRQSSQLIFSRWGIQGNQSAGYPEGTRKPAQGYSASARGYSEDARELHLEAPALMCSRNSRGRESAAQGAVEEGVEEAFRPPEFY